MRDGECNRGPLKNTWMRTLLAVFSRKRRKTRPERVCRKRIKSIIIATDCCFVLLESYCIASRPLASHSCAHNVPEIDKEQLLHELEERRQRRRPQVSERVAGATGRGRFAREEGLLERRILFDEGKRTK